MTAPEPDTRSVLDQLPGDLMMWVLIASELAVFGAGLTAFLTIRLTDPAGFAAAQDLLHRPTGAINTVILITSGFFAARAIAARMSDRRGPARLWLAAAGLGGLAFLAVKADEYHDLISAGIGTETHPFFTFYYLLTGFHAAHVFAGILILALIAWQDSPRNMETGVAFWHMVDLVWVLLFPVIYLLR
jgi:nitric oxide reductase NorE protein